MQVGMLHHTLQALCAAICVQLLLWSWDARMSTLRRMRDGRSKVGQRKFLEVLFPVRSMVGRLTLNQVIGVRVPDREPIYGAFGVTVAQGTVNPLARVRPSHCTPKFLLSA